MDLQEFLTHVHRRELIESGSDLHRLMIDASQEAMRIPAAPSTSR